MQPKRVQAQDRAVTCSPRLKIPGLRAYIRLAVIKQSYNQKISTTLLARPRICTWQLLISSHIRQSLDQRHSHHLKSSQQINIYIYIYIKLVNFQILYQLPLTLKLNYTVVQKLINSYLGSSLWIKDKQYWV